MSKDITVSMSQEYYNQTLKRAEVAAELKGYTKAWNQLVGILKAEMDGHRDLEYLNIPENLNCKGTKEIVQFIRLRAGLAGTRTERGREEL